MHGYIATVDEYLCADPKFFDDSVPCEINASRAALRKGRLLIKKRLVEGPVSAYD